LARDEQGRPRVRVVRHGHGRTATTEELTPRLVGVADLTTDDAYGDPEQTRHTNHRDDLGQPLTAEVVRIWNNRTRPAGSLVYLTRGPVADPFVVVDDDGRRVIENGIVKKGKHPGDLTPFPQKTEEAVIVHCFFTLMVMALYPAFRLWQARGAPSEAPADVPRAPAGGRPRPCPCPWTSPSWEAKERNAGAVGCAPRIATGSSSLSGETLGNHSHRGIRRSR
jgi:hypothetical protein